MAVSKSQLVSLFGNRDWEQGGASRQNRELTRREHSNHLQLTRQSKLTDIICVGYTISSGVRDSPCLQQQHWQQKQLPKHAIFVVVSRCVQDCSKTDNFYLRSKKNARHQPLSKRSQININNYTPDRVFQKCYYIKNKLFWFSCVQKAEDMTWSYLWNCIIPAASKSIPCCVMTIIKKNRIELQYNQLPVCAKEYNTNVLWREIFPGVTCNYIGSLCVVLPQEQTVWTNMRIIMKILQMYITLTVFSTVDAC